VNLLAKLLPEQASTVAGGVDQLFYFLCALSIAVSLVIAGLIMFFAIRYRRRTRDPQPLKPVGITHADMRRLEYAWIGVPLLIFMGIFYWAAKIYANIATVPDNAMQIYIVGKQWMWKAQHVSGRREINELHVPLGTAVKLTMTSEDVIHSFYVPAFRVKADVLPGRYTTLWFEATKTGEFHLFCAEYCGTKHSAMIGKIVVMEPKDFQAWLGGAAEGSLSAAGEKLFSQLGCPTCHMGAETRERGPDLRGLFGKEVTLQGGEVVVADESYLRESILDPRKRVVAGYQPLMPTYVAQLNEEKIIQLIAYIKSLARDEPGPGGRPEDGAAGQGAGGRGAGGADQGGGTAVPAPTDEPPPEPLPVPREPKGPPAPKAPKPPIPEAP
jgi:cytochrome c oxidase subunit 2